MVVMIVAEIGASHNGSLGRAFALIEAARCAGADAVKFQLYHPEMLAKARGGADKVLGDGPWKGERLGRLYARAHTPAVWMPALFGAAFGLRPFCSVFHADWGFDVLEGLGCPIYKISSFDIANKPLLRRVAATGKDAILSTGMASEEDVYEAARILPSAKFLHCVSAYPCPLEETQIWRLADMDGFSDHTLGSEAACMAIATGAQIIEKHIKLDGDNESADCSFATPASEFAKFVSDVRAAERSMRHGERKAEPYEALRVAAA